MLCDCTLFLLGERLFSYSHKVCSIQYSMGLSQDWLITERGCFFLSSSHMLRHLSMCSKSPYISKFFNVLRANYQFCLNQSNKPYCSGQLSNDTKYAQNVLLWSSQIWGYVTQPCCIQNCDILYISGKGESSELYV